MGAAIDAIGDTGKLFRHNAMLWAGGGALTAAIGLVWLVLSVIPLVGPFLSLFVTPILVTGILGMAYAGRNGDAGLGDFASGVGDNYIPYLAATLLLWGVSFVVSLVFAVVFMFVVGFGAMSASADAGFAAGFGIVVFFGMFAVFAVAGIVGLVVQFFDVAIVVDDAGPLGGFTKSLELVTSAPLSVLGYTVLRTVLGAVVFGLPLVVVMLVGAGLSTATTAAGSPAAAESFSVALLVGLALWALVILPVGLVGLLSYHAAFYNRHKAMGTV